MGVSRRGCAVGGPAGMTDPRRSADGGFIYQFDQSGKFSSVTPDRDLAVRQDSQSGRVVAAVFQPFQAVQNNRCRIPRTDITYDSTHGVPPNFSSLRGAKRQSNLLISCEIASPIRGLAMTWMLPPPACLSLRLPGSHCGRIRFRRERRRGYGIPGGHPLTVRFSFPHPIPSPVGRGARGEGNWLRLAAETLILVILRLRHALAYARVWLRSGSCAIFPGNDFE